jgi:hypothetical protein
MVSFWCYSDLMMEVYLRTMSDGRIHPDARCPTICYSRSGTRVNYIHSILITNYRLVVIVQLRKRGRGFAVIIWDWKSSQVLFVRRLFHHMALQATQVIIQELEYEDCESAEFIDDYLLLITLKSRVSVPPYLVIINTGKDIGGTPGQTTFHLPPHFTYSAWQSLISEPGMHNPPPVGSLAPFHRDPAQRIITLQFQSNPPYLVLRVGALLELLNQREGTEIGWDEWKNRVAMIPSLSCSAWALRFVQVSGCRLIYFWWTAAGSGSVMEVFDFSMQGRAKRLKEWITREIGTVNSLRSTVWMVKIPLEGFLGS